MIIQHLRAVQRLEFFPTGAYSLKKLVRGEHILKYIRADRMKLWGHSKWIKKTKTGREIMV
jgi:hypothetical protein